MANGVKQEAVNTFEKGIVKDLNAINTPNNVLTDCVNGTIITYDGNEYQLQNDKGNYLLKYTKLSENGFTPIGTASYGDILYIISYNPITKETEIGTFPSPAQHVIDENQELKATSILKSYNKEGEVEYTKLMKNFYQLIQFGATDKYKLYPGDMYKIEDVEEGYKYETIKYFIVTDENEIIDITENINDTTVKEDENGFRYVTWEVPGWLAVRWDLPIIEDFQLFPIQINPENGNSKINFRITSNDPTVEKAFDANDLGVLTDDATVSPLEIKSKDIYDAIKYFNLTYPIKFNVEGKQYLEIDSRPYIDSTKNRILYPYAEPLIVDLTNRFSKDNTNIASEYFTYTIDGNIITLNFNVDASIITTGNIELTLAAMKFTDYVVNNYELYPNNPGDEKWIELNGGENCFDGSGQQIIQFELPEGLEENIFILRIGLSDGVITPIYTYKTVISSEFMNNYTRDDYDDFSLIPVTDWGQNLNQVSVEFSEFKEPTYTNNKKMIVNSMYDKEYWSINDSSDTSGFFPEGSSVLTAEDEFKYELNYTANGDGKVSGKIVQKYLKNFCTINFANTSNYTVTGSSAIYNQDSFNFSPNDNVNPYSLQKFKAPEDLSETAATTANFKNSELEEVWDGKSLFNWVGLKEAFDWTNVRIYTDMCNITNNATEGAADLAKELYDSLTKAWKNRCNIVQGLAVADLYGFYSLRIKDKEGIIEQYKDIVENILGQPAQDLNFETKYYCRGIPVNKTIWYTSFVLTGSNLTLLRPIKADKKMKAILSDFRKRALSIKATIKDIYSKEQYKKGRPLITETETFESQKKLFINSGSIALPAVIHVKQQNSPKATVFSSNHLEHYFGRDGDQGDRCMLGIMFNDSTYGPLFIPTENYPNSLQKEGDEGLIKYEASGGSHDGKILVNDYYNIINNSDEGKLAYSAIFDILTSLKVNTKKKINSFGYFIQKEQTEREVFTDIPIEVNGIINVSSIILKDANIPIENVKISSDWINNFLSASSFSLFITDTPVKAISDYKYHVRNNDGSIIDTTSLENAMDDKLADSRNINTIVLQQYNTYPEMDMVKYINAGRSIGYININPEGQPGVTRLVNEILRWDNNIEYDQDTVSKYAVKLNSSGFFKMYFVSCRDNDISKSFDFDDEGVEKSDPCVPVCYSTIDSSKLLKAYWTEQNPDSEEIEYETVSTDNNTAGNISSNTITEKTEIAINDSESSSGGSGSNSGSSSDIFTINNTTINLNNYINSNITMKVGEGFRFDNSILELSDNVNNNIIEYNNYRNYIYALKTGVAILNIIQTETEEILGTITITVENNSNFIELSKIKIYCNNELVDTSTTLELPTNGTYDLYAIPDPKNATVGVISWTWSISNVSSSFNRTMEEEGNHFKIVTSNTPGGERYITLNMNDKQKSFKVHVYNPNSTT